MSIVNTQPAPGWEVYGSREGDHLPAASIAPGIERRVHTSRTAACRYTWERWALEVLGPPIEHDCEAATGWRQTAENGLRAVEFGGVTVYGLSGCYWMPRRPEEYTDPVAALAAAALDSLRGRL